MEIRPVLNKEEIQSLQVLKKERVDMSWNPAVNYLGAYVGGRLVGVVGCQRLGRNKLRYKSAGVLKEYRGQGIYTLLWKERDRIYNTGKETITAFCTEKSLPMFLQHGFKVISERNGITFVKRD
jgi:hypothetical protein